MKIKAGQWYRTLGAKIFKYTGTNVYEKTGTLRHLTENNYNKIIAVADTPQELVQVHDMIEVKGFEWGARKITNKHELKWLKEHKELILKILTPQGKNYICQWEGENEQK